MERLRYTRNSPAEAYKLTIKAVPLIVLITIRG